MCDREHVSIGCCEECGSKFLNTASKMKNLCPECAHIVYGCPKCNHVFENNRCIYCYWDGSKSEYIKQLGRK
ncbi:MAG: hypothetical protein J6C01_04785 [Lachnospiraceae bacterium]|nr:hypothetical protein [Lachnospiraceae bacterium]